jgi:hypothetical protein
MPLSTVLATKDTSPIVPQPLLLARFRFVDGSYLYLSTHPLNSTEGGYQYGGNNYLARLDSQDITQFGRSEQGIDRVPSVTLHIHDSDGSILSNYEFSSSKGFKGAILDLVAATFQCHNTTLIRYCDPGTRLRYLGHNGYFSSNFLAGDPANPGNRNPEVTYQLFAGDAASYDPSFPVVQLYFWCQDQAGTITDAKDPTLYEPPTAMPGT